MVVLGLSNPRGRPASSSRAGSLCLHLKGGTVPLVLLQVTAHLLLHVSDITVDPLDKPQLRHLIPAVLQIIPMAASRQLQLPDLVSQRR